MAPAPLFFTQNNIWQSFFRGARAKVGEGLYQIDPYTIQLPAVPSLEVPAFCASSVQGVPGCISLQSYPTAE